MRVGMILYSSAVRGDYRRIYVAFISKKLHTHTYTEEERERETRISIKHTYNRLDAMYMLTIYFHETHYFDLFKCRLVFFFFVFFFVFLFLVRSFVFFLFRNSAIEYH